MAKLDPTKMKDWQIAEAAEANLRKVADLAAELGLGEDEWEPYGPIASSSFAISNTWLIT